MPQLDGYPEKEEESLPEGEDDGLSTKVRSWIVRSPAPVKSRQLVHLYSKLWSLYIFALPRFYGCRGNYRGLPLFTIFFRLGAPPDDDYDEVYYSRKRTEKPSSSRNTDPAPYRDSQLRTSPIYSALPSPVPPHRSPVNGNNNDNTMPDDLFFKIWDIPEVGEELTGVERVAIG